jgi:hypothetical protein
VRCLERPRRRALKSYIVCSSRIKDAGLRGRMDGIRPEIARAGDAFEAAMKRGDPASVATSDNVGEVTGAEMSALYVQRMAKIGAPGRQIYDELVGAAPASRCPLCAQRRVSTLDHYLPKAAYPSLAVAPDNLIPACADCNKSKSGRSPSNRAIATLHPYYDAVEDEVWLEAAVIGEAPAALRFYVGDVGAWDKHLLARVRCHFEVFGLGPLYAVEAADEMASIRDSLRRLDDAGGAASVRAWLEDRRQSCRANALNSWRTATYTALAGSDWYCQGGFNL